MTVSNVIRSANLRPVPTTHGQSRIARHGTDQSLSAEQLDSSFEEELQTVQRFHEINSNALQNLRSHIGQAPRKIRIISRDGYNSRVVTTQVPRWTGRSSLEFTHLEGQPAGAGSPAFRYLAPKVSVDGAHTFSEDVGIRLVVMHSFGRGFDFGKIKNNPEAHTVRIDPQTGHNPRRFFNGLNTLINPRLLENGANKAAIHHAVSLRGDLINSTSWDDTAIHGGGGSHHNPPLLPVVGATTNSTSIGIEHEEWYARPRGYRGRIREIQDHGPFSEEQYTIDAFILKKLEAYTGRSFTTFLGRNRDAVEGVLDLSKSGCVNHRDLGGHADPGAEYFISPGYEVGVSSYRDFVSNRFGAWEQRETIWWSDVPRGTKISAYDRIFEKMGRMRSFNLQTEVFDRALGGGPITVSAPGYTPGQSNATAALALRDHLNSIHRGGAMTDAARRQIYANATDAAGTTQAVLHGQTARLAAVAQAPDPPRIVVENPHGFDPATGTWS